MSLFPDQDKIKRKYNTSGLFFNQTRHCIICGSDYQGKGNSKYCSATCLSRNEYAANMLKVDWRLGKLLAAAKNRAKTKNLPFDLDVEYLINLWNSNNGQCEISKRSFDLNAWGEKGQVNPNAPSVDRINPKLGYVKGNIRLVIYHINVALSEFGLEAFMQLAGEVTSKGK